MLHSSYLAAALTGSTGLYAASVFCPITATGITGSIFLYFNIFGNAFGYFFIIQLKLYTKVAAPYTTRPLSATPCPSAAKKTPKNIITENLRSLLLSWVLSGKQTFCPHFFIGNIIDMLSFVNK